MFAASPASVGYRAPQAGPWNMLRTAASRALGLLSPRPELRRGRAYRERRHSARPAEPRATTRWKTLARMVAPLRAE